MLIMKRGFTLIELLVVISIIGILSSIVLTNLNTSRQKARDVKRTTDIKSIQLSLQLYLDYSGGKYPGVLATLVPDFLPNVPVPPTGVTGVSSYVYVPLNIGSACNSYHIGSALELENVLMNSDSDAVPGQNGSTVASAVDCNNTGIPATQDFYGNGDTCKTTSGGTDKCFDVTP